MAAHLQLCVPVVEDEDVGMIVYLFFLTIVFFFPLQASEEHLTKHYIDLKEKPFFKDLIKYMSSGPVVAMVSLHQAV